MKKNDHHHHGGHLALPVGIIKKLILIAAALIIWAGVIWFAFRFDSRRQLRRGLTSQSVIAAPPTTAPSFTPDPTVLFNPFAPPPAAPEPAAPEPWLKMELIDTKKTDTPENVRLHTRAEPIVTTMAPPGGQWIITFKP